MEKGWKELAKRHKNKFEVCMVANDLFSLPMMNTARNFPVIVVVTMINLSRLKVGGIGSEAKLTSASSS
jgi:hypothetical protein